MTEYRQVKISETEIDYIGNVTVVRFCEPRIGDLLAVEELGRELYELIEQRVNRKLVLDFSGVRFFSSAAIGKLISLNGRLKALGGVLKLCNLPPEILEVFHVCKLDRLFDIRQDQAEAMLSFGN